MIIKTIVCLTCLGFFLWGASVGIDWFNQRQWSVSRSRNIPWASIGKKPALLLLAFVGIGVAALYLTEELTPSLISATVLAILMTLLIHLGVDIFNQRQMVRYRRTNRTTSVVHRGSTFYIGLTLFVMAFVSLTEGFTFNALHITSAAVSVALTSLFYVLRAEFKEARR